MPVPDTVIRSQRVDFIGSVVKGNKDVSYGFMLADRQLYR